jgi:hypothetical protein
MNHPEHLDQDEALIGGLREALFALDVPEMPPLAVIAGRAHKFDRRRLPAHIGPAARAAIVRLLHPRRRPFSRYQHPTPPERHGSGDNSTMPPKDR